MSQDDGGLSAVERLEFSFARRLPVLVCAGEDHDPALLCLKMIMAFYRVPDAMALKAEAPDPAAAAGADAYGPLAALAGRHGLVTRQVTVSASELRMLSLPCVLRTSSNRYAVLAKVGRSMATLHDPLRGVRRVRLAELARQAELRILEVQPSWSFTQRNAPRRLKWSDILGKVTGLKRSLTLIGTMALAIELLAMLGPLQMQWTTDHAIAGGDRDLVLLLTVSFMLLLLLRVLVETARSWAVLTLTAKFNLQWMTNVTRHLFRLPLSYFEKHHIGDTLSRMGVIQSIEHTLTVGFLEALIDGVMAIGTVVVILVYSPLLSLVGLAAGLLYFGVRTALYASMRSQNGASIVSAMLQQTFFLETVRGIQSIKSLGLTERRLGRWLDIAVTQKNAELRIAQLKAVFRSLRLGLFGAAHILLIGLASRTALDAQLSVGMVMSLVYYQDQFLRRTGGFVDRLFDIKLMELLAGRLSEIVLAKVEQGVAPAVKSAEPASSALHVKGLRCRYGERDRAVLDKVSFRVEPGELVALKGGPASGKSTLARALLGLVPISGDIELGGCTQVQLGWQRYRSLVHGVMATDALLAGSIGENIACFAADRRQDRIAHCAWMAGIHDEISRLPLGYETEVSYTSSVLSGSQVQRILLARALYGAPRVLVLDEALSLVPAELELAILGAIKREGISCIVASSRSDLSTLADKCLWLRGGTVVAAAYADNEAAVVQMQQQRQRKARFEVHEGQLSGREGR